MLGNILAENSGAAVTFNDAESAENVLAALKENTTVIASGLYRTEEPGVFAEYPSPGAAEGLEAIAKRSGVWLDDIFYLTSVPVKVNDQQVGQLVIKSNLTELEQFKEGLLTLFTFLFVGLLLLTLLISYWLKTNITNPLASLSEWATQVSQHKSFDARAHKQNDDEIGHLVDSLNEMLSELAKQETIVSLNQELEREIQERKLIECDLIAMRNRAEEANKAKSRFLANMSHELRTPLNAIIGYSEMLQEIVAEDDFEAEEIIQDIDKVRSAGKHLLSLINDILDISKIEAGKMQISIEAFSMQDLVQDVVDTLKPLSDVRHDQLMTSIDGDVGTIHSDMVKVRQILFNLMSNAVKFTQHGEVELSCYREVDADEDWVVCCVRDTGIGISDEALKELFKPFSQADPTTTRKYGGTGLGLAISRSYITMLGGDIRAESREGKGSKFTFRLPVKAMIEDDTNADDSIKTDPAGLPTYLTAQARQNAKIPTETGHKSDDESEQPVETRVLLIDDDEATHDRLRFHLGKHGFAVYSAMSGEEGMAMARTQPFAVIILDIFMPGIDGWQVLQRLKSNPSTAQIPVVMYTIESNEAKGFSLGAADYLIKPINGKRLLSTLGRYKKPNKRLKVLSIDDDVHSQELILAYLNGPDWEVTTADSGREGLKILTEKPDYAVILLDLVMPEMNGFQFIEACSKSAVAGNIPIIVISARDLTRQERQLLVDHAQAIIRKGMYDRNTLVSSIKQVLNRQPSLSSREGD